MPGLVPGIHVFFFRRRKDVDGRDKPGHDEERGALASCDHDNLSWLILARGVAFFALHHMMIII
jgi:hypothetical protein